jgi:nucleoside-diphosphate-sugar epimerase
MMESALPEMIHTEEELEELISRPTPAAVRAMESLPGDLMLLGVGGKMGPSLARMALRASETAGHDRRIIGVSRFSDPESRRQLEDAGVETIAGDLLDEQFLLQLPDIPNLICMTGMKFGASQDPAKTWAVNVHMPSLICRRFPESRLVAFSTGNVYPLVPVDGNWSSEAEDTGPVGEYAMTALGRERMYQYFSGAFSIPMALLRLNYAIEMRYGVLVDIANKVFREEPIDLTTGYANVLWQGDANAMALAAFADVSSPPWIINLAGPEKVGVRDTAEAFGKRFGIAPVFEGTEATTALLSDGSRGHQRYGHPRVPLEQMIDWIAHWIQSGGPLLDKPTHFETRTGKF